MYMLVHSVGILYFWGSDVFLFILALASALGFLMELSDR
jgi:hypothetical protein